MSNRSERQLLDDQLEAMGRIERRHLLLQLSTASPGEEPHVDFGDVERKPDGLDPLVAMRHLHLPVLEEREYIRWDRESHRITRGPRFHELEPFLQLFRELRAELPERECD